MENNTGVKPDADGRETENNGKKTSVGMDENLEGLLCYLFGWVTGLIFLLAEKNSRFVRFHAVQSLALGLAVTAVYILLDNILLAAFWYLWALVSLLTGLLGIGYLAVSIFLMVKAHRMERFGLPVIGDFAAKQADKA